MQPMIQIIFTKWKFVWGTDLMFVYSCNVIHEFHFLWNCFSWVSFFLKICSCANKRAHISEVSQHWTVSLIGCKLSCYVSINTSLEWKWAIFHGLEQCQKKSLHFWRNVIFFQLFGHVLEVAYFDVVPLSLLLRVPNGRTIGIVPCCPVRKENKLSQVDLNTIKI